ncbi:MAG: DHHW family protein [Bacillota bacterium]
MRKISKDSVLIAFFCAFLGVFCLLYIVLPDQRFSVNEKRVLQPEPQLNSKALFSGAFGKDFEKYLSDHFAGRDFFVGLNSYYDLGIGRNGVKGVYAGKDGYLIETPVEDNRENLSKNIAAIARFSEKVGIKPGFMLVPSTGYIYGEKLPAVHNEYKDGQIIDSAESALGKNVQPIDLVRPFKENKDRIQLFYKTDHHWTSRGAYVAYRAYCAEKGLKPVPLDRFEVQSEGGFYGTTYSRSALWLSSPDTIDLFLDKTKPSFKVEIPETKTTSDSLFFMSHLKEPDKYPVFLDGNHGFEKITNENVKGGKLLLIKDSFAHAIVPFLAENYHEIYMVDLRYYKESISKLIKDNGISDILVLYGVGNFVNDTNLTWLQ